MSITVIKEVEVEVEVEIDEVIDELDDEELIQELKKRHLHVPSINYESICDLLGMSHHTPVDFLMQLLSVELIRQKV